jgi:hypothetical protein
VRPYSSDTPLAKLLTAWLRDRYIIYKDLPYFDLRNSASPSEKWFFVVDMKLNRHLPEPDGSSEAAGNGLKVVLALGQESKESWKPLSPLGP